jgi:RNA polymerase sigma-70 factor (ECF subfamily)
LERISRAEQVELLREAIAGLNAADQEILALRHTAGLSFAQIAETLGQPLGTVLARGHRALGKLRKLLEDQQ